MKFRNPTNGHIEEKTAPWLGALLFGGLFLLFNGLWAGFLVWFVLAAIFFGSLGVGGLLPMMVINLLFAFAAKDMVRSAYLKKGWIDVTDGDAAGPAGDFRKCPYCAEEIRKEAVKCKHCGSDVAGASAAPPAPIPAGWSATQIAAENRAKAEWQNPV